MHTITERTEELVREAGIRTRIAFDTLVERALIIGALITAKVPSKIGDAAGSLIDEISKGGKKDG